MSLLTIIQNVADDLGLDQPDTVIGNTNDQVVQLLRLANREGTDLAKRYPWKVLRRQNSFTLTTGQKSQGAFNSTVVTDGDYDYILKDTFWNQTLSEPIVGPITSVEIETLESFPVSGPYQRWYQLGKNLYIDPAPTVANTCQFQYISKWWCESSGGTGQAAWAADSDVGRLDEGLMELGILWRWLRRKGLDYAEEMATYERRLADAIAREGSKPKLDMSGGRGDRLPGVFVPQGNWNL